MLTLNQRVQGSSPCAPTIEIKDLRPIMTSRFPAKTPGVCRRVTGSLRMIRIAITVEAYEAIVATLPLGSVGYEPQLNGKGERLIWVEAGWHDKLAAMREPGESYSDVILRLVEQEAQGLRR